jgi:formate dehydrogenase iron-sulfur subunit
MLVDVTRCVGCRSCENACLLRQGRPGLPASFRGYAPGDGKLTFATRTFVDRVPAEALGGRPRTIPVKRQCMHCLDPACASVCPVGALHRLETGPVVYDADKCIGCRYCLFACPFSVPRYEWDSGLAPKVGKCDFCADRQARGMPPACAAACPTGALRFGPRARILGEARARMEASPGRYTHIYGEEVVGGTSWLYLSDVPPEVLGFPAGLEGTPLPSLTWQALQKVPVVIVVLGLFLSLARRRTARAQAAAGEAGHGR